jgi:hypothetical protein
MNVSSNKSRLDAALANVSNTFRGKIVKCYLEVRRHSVDGNVKALGLSAAHLCEVVLRLLQQETVGRYIPFGSKIPNFADECRRIVTSTNMKVVESLRVVVPRALVFIYTVRNKRGIGHVGGDIDANRIDAATISRNCGWLICELIRVYHNLPIEEAQDLVDSLSEKSMADIWEVGGKKRVLRQDLDFKQKVLLLCYQNTSHGILSEDLFDWVEYSNYSIFKKKVLKSLHNGKLVEYDQQSEFVVISPLGIEEVEQKIIKP